MRPRYPRNPSDARRGQPTTAPPVSTPHPQRGECVGFHFIRFEDLPIVRRRSTSGNEAEQHNSNEELADHGQIHIIHLASLRRFLLSECRPEGRVRDYHFPAILIRKLRYSFNQFIV